MQGKIIKIISNDYTVLSDKLYTCKVRGKFRNLKITPLVGDNVIFDKDNKYIEDEKYLYYVSITRAQHKLIVYNQ